MSRLHNYNFVHGVSAPLIGLDGFCSNLFFFSFFSSNYSPIFLLHPAISLNFAGIDSENSSYIIHELINIIKHLRKMVLSQTDSECSYNVQGSVSLF